MPAAAPSWRHTTLSSALPGGCGLLESTPLTSDLQAGRNRSDWNCTVLHIWRQVGACRRIPCCSTIRGRSGAAPQLCRHEQCGHSCPGQFLQHCLSKRRHAGAAVLAWALPAHLPRAVPAATCTENIIDSCRFSRVLHDPAVPPAACLTRAVYTDAKRQQTTLNHFHEKLLHIKVQLNACSCCLFAHKAAPSLAAAHSTSSGPAHPQLPQYLKLAPLYSGHDEDSTRPATGSTEASIHAGLLAAI